MLVAEACVGVFVDRILPYFSALDSLVDSCKVDSCSHPVQLAVLTMANVLSNSDLQALKAYVSAPGKFGANQADSTVLLHVTHSNLRAEFMEIRFDKHVRYQLTQSCF